MDLEGLSGAVNALVAADPAAFADGDTIIALQQLQARIDAFITAATATFDTSKEWNLAGARNAAAWITARCRIPAPAAHRQTRLARALRDLPVAAAAWRQGTITAAHVEILAGLRRPATTAALARDETLLVGHAQTLTYRQFTQTAAYWEQHADPDGIETRAAAQRDRRDVYLNQSFQGNWLGGINLDLISGTIVANELRRLEEDLFHTDWTEAATRLGHQPKVADLARTAPQRRADALVTMATRSATTPADGQKPRPLFTVLVDYPTLHHRICELANHTVLTPGSLLPYLEEADIERAVFKPHRRVEVSATTRFFTGATRRAIQLRDHTCTHPYCEQPAQHCEIDHITPHAHGGPTTQQNGRLLCRYHNQLRQHTEPGQQRPPPRK